MQGSFFPPLKIEIPKWLKSKGYIHITAQISTSKRSNELIKKVKSHKYVSEYAFFPLIHATLDERRYKKISKEESIRAHSYWEGAIHKKSIKKRPLHYATHMDAIIFGYYAELIQNRYDQLLSQDKELNESIIAYRRIKIDGEDSNKSTIHFANEVFNEIKERTSQKGQCAVLAFDIENFFPSLDHEILKKAWMQLFDYDRLPADHFNVFKASTQFCYILRDDLRSESSRSGGRKRGFNEKELARIRNKFGIDSFFESPKAFREKIRTGDLKIYKYPFWNKNKNCPCGIPQGLPISATLANLYLLSFDIEIIQKIVTEFGGFYRRYSDDIVIICDVDKMTQVEATVNDAIGNSELIISQSKTEKFIFKPITYSRKGEQLRSFKLRKGKEIIGAPLTYLGFEFNGKNVLIKSSNIAKFYRKMISSVKRKASRAKKQVRDKGGENPVVFRRQLYKLYTSRPLHNVKVHTRWKQLVKNDFGEFRIRSGMKTKLFRSNYLTYVRRAGIVMNEPGIAKQIKKHSEIFNESIKRHLKSSME
jgi:hypothetical protein